MQISGEWMSEKLNNLIPTSATIFVVLVPHACQVGLALQQLALMLVFGSFVCRFKGHVEIINRFKDEVICVDALALASLHSLLSQLIRLLAVLVDKPESFLVLFLVLGGTLWQFASRS